MSKYSPIDVGINIAHWSQMAPSAIKRYSKHKPLIILAVPSRPPLSERPFVSLNDWQRGEDGWDGETVNGIGACDGTPGYTTSNFQQNPCDIPNWLIPNWADPILATTEQEEAGADMFLNWVYRTITDTSGASLGSQVPGSWEGFRNQKWLNNQAGTNDDNYPGDARFAWMNVVMREIFTQKGW